MAGETGVLATGLKGVSALGTAASGVGAVASLFQKKPQAPDTSAMTAAAEADRAKAAAEKRAVEEENEKRLRMLRSGQVGQRSLFSNGEEGFQRTLGAG